MDATKSVCRSTGDLLIYRFTVLLYAVKTKGGAFPTIILLNTLIEIVSVVRISEQYCPRILRFVFRIQLNWNSSDVVHYSSDSLEKDRGKVAKWSRDEESLHWLYYITCLILVKILWFTARDVLKSKRSCQSQASTVYPQNGELNPGAVCLRTFFFTVLLLLFYFIHLF